MTQKWINVQCLQQACNMHSFFLNVRPCLQMELILLSYFLYGIVNYYLKKINATAKWFQLVTQQLKLIIWKLTSPFVSWCNECLSFPHSINHPISNNILLDRQMVFFLKDKLKLLKITYYISRTIKMHPICFEKYNWIEIQFIE